MIKIIFKGYDGEYEYMILNRYTELAHKVMKKLEEMSELENNIDIGTFNANR